MLGKRWSFLLFSLSLILVCIIMIVFCAGRGEWFILIIFNLILCEGKENKENENKLFKNIVDNFNCMLRWGRIVNLFFIIVFILPVFCFLGKGFFFPYSLWFPISLNFVFEMWKCIANPNKRKIDEESEIKYRWLRNWKERYKQENQIMIFRNDLFGLKPKKYHWIPLWNL